MKVIIPADTNRLDSPVFGSFGRAPWFALFDTEHNALKFIENSAASSQGGAGVKAAQAVLDSGAEAVITPRLGQNAAEVFSTADVKIYEAQEASIEKNIEWFTAGKLKPLTQVHPGIHGGAHS
jgi:predicted Fe-Mo cluster-binding NifX family protein